MTKIEWTHAPGFKGETWNPIVGCDIESAGCKNCYAMKQAHRIEKMQPGGHYKGTTKLVKGKAVWTGKVKQAPKKNLTAPLRWSKPRLVFVNSMGDLLHPNVPVEWIDRVFAVMALAPQHKFLVLTKHPKRMREYLTAFKPAKSGHPHDPQDHYPYVTRHGTDVPDRPKGEVCFHSNDWPLPNVGLGVSVENQETADKRIPKLLQTPAAMRFVSYEPALCPVDFTNITASTPTGDEQWNCLDKVEARDAEGPAPKTVIDQIIMGGESGKNARPLHAHWVRQTRDQCAAAGTPFFLKQLGNQVGERPENFKEWWTDSAKNIAAREREIITLKHRKGADPLEWPEDFRIQQFPEWITTPSQQQESEE